ncbi:NUDIX domain-containing protein [Aquisalibacillus elongatus]|uniref:Putative (Di)nucleoside polyphosphate hydrolase n=1 Tax=Aquisalibacillus elongatus TaxID=485577 RepID=A0A3N5AZQ3_9BACI|nr:NUDIX domain-containing protein [Aquisalibacillus elongatus]RPF50409.1 putative (di)nucleoside polyphosphate hydrolase [Aquisalibacillus elongatus]
MIRKAVGAIVFQGNKFLIVHKTKINTNKGKQIIEGEWDFIKGGIEKDDMDLSETLLRELEEETGSKEYKVVKEFDEKICFEFPDEIKPKVGYDKQETTIFLVEFLGDINALNPNDNEISDLKFIEKDKVAEILTHHDTKEFFLSNI